MTWIIPWIPTIVSAIGTVVGYNNAKKEQNMAQKAYDQANPFGPYRPEYAQKLHDLMNDPSLITKDPGYQFQFDQGQKAVDRSMAAKGFLGSGNEAIALTQYGQGYAQNYLKQQETFLAELAGAGINPSSATQSIGAFGQGNQDMSSVFGSLQYALPGIMKMFGGGGGLASSGTPSGTSGFNFAGMSPAGD